jgi:predicted ABC-type ATPase
MKRALSRALSLKHQKHRYIPGMSDPTLLVVAGCNGSGKSTFSRLLVNPDYLPFDYDLHFLKFYRSLLDSDFREEMANNMAFFELERQIAHAIAYKENFCYETNFNSTPLHWPQHFKQKGYKLHLIYLCLDSIEEAKQRVAIRVQNGGHI